MTESEADYGESTPVWLASFDRASCSWRTSGLFAAEDSPLYSETLPRSGMTRSGTLSLLPPLVRLIYGTGSGSLLPTPRAADHDSGPWTPPNGQGQNLRAALLPTPMHSDVDRPRRSPGSIERGGGPKLLDVLLPTPTANDYGTTNNGKRGDGSTYATKGKPSLSTMARRGLIPTPTAGDANSSGSRNTATSKAHPGVSLTDWARGDGGTGRLLPTPQAQDHRNCADYSDGSRGHSPQLRHLGRGRLNPRFVEWMMNFPEGWTDVPEGSSATR